MLNIFRGKKALEEKIAQLEAEIAEKNDLVKQSADMLLDIYNKMEDQKKALLGEVGDKSSLGSLSFWFKGMMLLYLYSCGGEAEIDEEFIASLNKAYDFEYDESTGKYRIKNFDCFGDELAN